jgi:hypothetical protein
MDEIRAGTKMTCPTCGLQLVVIAAPSDSVSCCGAVLVPDSAKERGDAKSAG